MYKRQPYSWLALEGKAPELSVMTEIGYDVITLSLIHILAFAGDP